MELDTSEFEVVVREILYRTSNIENTLIKSLSCFLIGDYFDNMYYNHFGLFLLESQIKALPDMIRVSAEKNKYFLIGYYIMKCLGWRFFDANLQRIFQHMDSAFITLMNYPANSESHFWGLLYFSLRRNDKLSKLSLRNDFIERIWEHAVRSTAENNVFEGISEQRHRYFFSQSQWPILRKSFQEQTKRNGDNMKSARNLPGYLKFLEKNSEYKEQLQFYLFLVDHS